MRIFHCDHCGQPVYFENILCENCGHKLAYLPDLNGVFSLDSTGKKDHLGELFTTPVPRANGQTYRLCANYTTHNICNWALRSDDASALCMSCRLTLVIPDLISMNNKTAWAKLETAKRRLVYSLVEKGLRVRNKTEEPITGLGFELKADHMGAPRVLTGHEAGVITLNIDEADDVQREKHRVSMHEPYRTLLGHFRHEIGHYYWDRLIRNSPRLENFRQLFGYELNDYMLALNTYYAQGPRPNWKEQFISAYASAHPWEDWAETWAHYLHMTDTLETAAAWGLSMHLPQRDLNTMEQTQTLCASRQSFDDIINKWFPLTFVLNSLNRDMGMPDAYPFVLSPPTVQKLRFVHETIHLEAQANGQG